MSTVYRKPLMAFGSSIDNYTEAQFQACIKKELGPYYGWERWHHEKFSMGTKPGFPDLTGWHERLGGVVFFEVKGPRGTVDDLQLDTLQSMRRAGMHAYLVRGCDHELVQLILRGEIDPPDIGTGRVDPRVASLVELEETMPRRAGRTRA